MNINLERHREYATKEAEVIAGYFVQKFGPRQGLNTPEILGAMIIAAGSIYAARLRSMDSGSVTLPNPEL